MVLLFSLLICQIKAPLKASKTRIFVTKLVTSVAFLSLVCYDPTATVFGNPCYCINLAGIGQHVSDFAFNGFSRGFGRDGDLV